MSHRKSFLNKDIPPSVSGAVLLFNKQQYCQIFVQTTLHKRIS